MKDNQEDFNSLEGIFEKRLKSKLDIL